MRSLSTIATTKKDKSIANELIKEIKWNYKYCSINQKPGRIRVKREQRTSETHRKQMA